MHFHLCDCRSCPGLTSGRPLHGQAGVALVAVLWMTAALAILVSGLVFSVKIDTRLEANHYDAVRARHLLDGALRLAAAELSQQTAPSSQPAMLEYQIGEARLSVEVTQASGFISLNTAPESLLADLFQYGAGLEADQALTLAQRVVDWRDPDDEALPLGAEAPEYEAAGVTYLPRNEAFLHPDDLGQVLGMSSGVHDKIRGLITVLRGGGAGAVNPLVAGPEVLTVLAKGDAGLAESLISLRTNGADNLTNTGELDMRHVREWFGNDFRLRAVLAGNEGESEWSRVAWVTRRPGSPPWQWAYAEQPVRKAGGKNGKG